MDGSIQARENKKGQKVYDVLYRVEDPRTGKKKQMLKRGFKTKKEAQEFLVGIQNKILTGSYVSPDNLTLKDYLKDWLKVYAEPNLKPATIDGYRNNIERHIIPCIGHIPLQKLKAANIQEFYALKLKGDEEGNNALSGKSVVYIHRVLSQALKHALNKQLIPRNVANEVTPPKIKKFKSEVYDVTEIQKLLDIAKNTAMEVPVTLAALLGLRRGEVLGLKWDRVDFKNKTVIIDRQLSKSSKGPLLDSTKTESSNRDIPISDNIVKLLKSQKKKQLQDKLLLGNEYNDNNFVVCRINGDLISPDAFSHDFAQFLKDNNLKHIRFHDLRHSYATMMLAHGESIHVTSKLMGHSSIKVTGDIYAHILDDVKRRASDNIDKLIFNSAKNK
ncbi:MAG TPA: site-specific integrase [Patescibacteria group bacterium]|nr:site-specific integrase [Patescibacteria group bacterium]